MTDFRIQVEDQQVRNALQRLITAGTDLSPVTRVIATHLKSITEEAFAKEQDPATGKPWAPLSAVTLRRRAKSGNISAGGAQKLQVSRNLLGSILADYDATTASVGTNLVYATTQHYGAKQGQFGRGNYRTRQGSFPIPWGDIPPRPFFGLNSQHQDEITDTIADHIRQLWSD